MIYVQHQQSSLMPFHLAKFFRFTFDIRKITDVSSTHPPKSPHYKLATKGSTAYIDVVKDARKVRRNDK